MKITQQNQTFGAIRITPKLTAVERKNPISARDISNKKLIDARALIAIY
jgi:hypothetical protein